MKKGKDLAGLVEEIVRQAKSKRDYIANTCAVSVSVEDGIPTLTINGVNEQWVIQPIAHRQIGEKIGIPAKYYNRMLQEAPDLLATNINHWFHNKPERRMFRTLDGKCRAFLSNRYRRLDNYELLEAVLPTLKEVPGLRIESCEVTEKRMYLKAVTPRIEDELRPGDIVNAGIAISNSEVGLGSFRVEPLVYRLVCRNGLIVTDHSLQKYHTGRRIEPEDERAYELFSDETLQADDRAFWLKARDIVRAALSEVAFKRIVQEMREAGEREIRDPIKTVQELSNKYRLTQEDNSGILRFLIESGDLSALGLANATTQYSQSVEDYDKATELERLGGEIIAMEKRDWEALVAT